MKNFKKLTALLLALVMVFALSVSAFAATTVVTTQDESVLKLESTGNTVSYMATTVDGGVKDGVTYETTTISTLTGIVGDIRSTIAYDNGYVYFTTKGGYFYKAAVSNDGTLSNLTSFKMAYMATGTPVVYNGVAFVTCGGADQFNSAGTVYAVNVATMNEISKATTPAYVQASLLLSTAYEKTAAIKEINDYVSSLDKSKYSDKNWTKITDLQSTAIRNINKAPYTEEIDRIVANALDEIKAVKAGEITVTFRLVGALEATQDVNLTTDSYLPEYVTWIPTTTYSLDAGATVYDVFMEALKDAGISQVGADSNYVRTIYAPTCLGGYALSEFTNGKRSGWMYTVNGSHPNQGLKKWELHDKDVVVWHYVNDYAHEVADWFNDPQYPALGDGTYYNGWLRAADITPERYVEQLLGKILTVGEHGKAEPKLTFQHIGKSVTFTFIPDKGYKVKDVKVNGKSVGAVTTYTIDKLTVSTRIERPQNNTLQHRTAPKWGAALLAAFIGGLKYEANS